MARIEAGRIYVAQNFKLMDGDGNEVKLPTEITADMLQPETEVEPVKFDVREWVAMFSFTVTLDMREYMARLWAEKVVAGTIEMMRQGRGE